MEILNGETGSQGSVTPRHYFTLTANSGSLGSAVVGVIMKFGLSKGRANWKFYARIGVKTGLGAPFLHQFLHLLPKRRVWTSIHTLLFGNIFYKATFSRKRPNSIFPSVTAIPKEPEQSLYGFQVIEGKIKSVRSMQDKVYPTIPPGPSGRALLAELQLLQRDPLSLLVTGARRYGDIACYTIGPWKAVLLNHPDAIQHVLQANSRNYSKNTFQYNLLSSITGNGLLTSDGDDWLQQRRLIQPSFHRRQVQSFAELMTAATTRMLERWDRCCGKGEAIDVDGEMMRLALEIVGQALFKIDFSGEAGELARSVVVVLDHIVHRARHPLALPARFPSPRNRRFQAALKKLDASVYDLIRKRRQELAALPLSKEFEKPDLLTLLLQARDEGTGAGMSDQQLRDEILTLIIAGHETVASALTWTWYLLSQNPPSGELFYTELTSTLGGRPPTAADLAELPFTRMVFEEALRLYPPAWIITRRASHEDEIPIGKGYKLPTGALVVISPYLIHRHPQFWDEPEIFDPARFSKGRSTGRPRYAYIPFGGGPRLCIGDYFATVEAQLVLATVGQRYRLELLPGHPVEPAPLVTLRPRQGLMMKLVPTRG